MSSQVESLSIRLLGRFEVWRNGSQILEDEWTRRKTKWLLSLLLSQPGHVFSYDVLIDALLEQSDPDKALRNLYGLVSKLRRILEPGLDRAANSAFIQRKGEGYCFNADAPYSVDTERFESLVREGASLESMSRWSEARDRYQQAVDLYIDGFLPENRYDEWTLLPREYWRDRYVQALDGLASCQATMSDFASAIETCRRITRYWPHNESAYRKRMYYHYCAGEYDQAEETFRACAEALEENLGVEPSDEIVQLHEEIVARRAPRIARWTPTNLPHSLTSFVGRTAEVAEVGELLRANRLATLVGAGGIGKTRLALKVGSELLNEFDDGVWTVDLGSVSDPALVAEVVVMALGADMEQGQSPEDVLVKHLRSGRLLLILDTCEHLVDECARLAEVLLEQCPELRILATSRELLRVFGEASWSVPPLRVPEVSSSVEELAESDAVGLFLERVRLNLPEFSVSPENAESIAQLCRNLEGLPLAIELAASRVRTVPLDEVARQTSDLSWVEDWEARTRTPRHSSLGAAISWSYNLLSAEEQAVLRRSAVFVGGFGLEAANEVLTDEGGNWSDVLHSLSGLVEKSLVVFDATPGSERYRLLDTVRAYARERLAEEGEEKESRTWHRDFYVGLAERAVHELRGPAQSEWFRRLDDELSNVRAALRWSLESGEIEGGMRLVTALTPYWEARLRQDEAMSWLERFMATGRETSKAIRARALRGHALLMSRWSRRWRGNPEEYRKRATEELTEACSLFREIGDRLMHAKTLLVLALVENSVGEREKARALYEEVLVVYRELGNRGGVAACLGNLGIMHLAEGADDTALALLEEALCISREIGDIGKARALLRHIGHIHEDREDFDRARKLYEEGLALAREIGSAAAESVMLVELGTLGLSERGAYQGDRNAARGHWDRALVLVREIDRSGTELFVLMNYAPFLCCEGDHAQAKSVLSRALPLALRLGANDFTLSGAMFLADVVFTQGDPEGAMELLGAAIAAHPEKGYSHPVCRRHYERISSKVRAQLDDAAAEEAFSRGKTMSIEDAIARALGTS